MMDKSGAEEGEVITGRLITAAIEGAQKRVEMQNFQQRKRALEYDDVLNQQRDVIYSTRLFALERGEELKAEALKMITAGVERHVTEQLGAAAPEQWDRALLKEGLMMQFLIAVDAVEDPALTPDLDRMLEVTREEATATFHRKLDYLTDFGARIGIPDVPLQVLSQVTLGVLDEKWKDHLYDLDQLRNAIHYRAYGQKDPLIEYKKEAFEMFEDLLRDIQATFADRFLKVQVNVNAPPPPPPPPTRAVPPVAPAEPSTDDLFRGGAPTRLPSPAVAATGPSGAAFGAAALPAADTAVGRNDPCPCGSGKKYKKCHGASA
jgi:preprotein translocase subunit SecA